jgi:hypothetical protein
LFLWLKLIQKLAMLCSHNTVLINRRIEDVYQFIAVDFFENYQKWSPEVCELEQLSSGEMRVGVTGRQVRYDRGYRSEAYFRVTEMMPLRELRFTSLSKPEFDVCYLFEPAAAATRLTFNFQLSPPLLMLPLHGLIEDVIEQGGRRVITNLQTLLETDVDALTAGATYGQTPG